MMCSCIRPYIGHLRRAYTACIVYVTAEELPDNGFVIEIDSILLQFIPELHHDHQIPHSNDNSNNTEADIENVFVNPMQPPVQPRT